MIKDTLFIIGLLVFVVASMYSMYVTFSKQSQVTVVYDCRVSEISPDFPLEAKQRCRELLNRGQNGKP